MYVYACIYNINVCMYVQRKNRLEYIMQFHQRSAVFVRGEGIYDNIGGKAR